jgi:hypothetical protein
MRREFFAAQGHSAKAFEFVEEVFDLLSLLVEPPVDGRGDGTAGFGLDLSGCTEVIGDEGSLRVAILEPVSDWLNRKRIRQREQSPGGTSSG